MRGRGYLFLTVILFRALQSTHMHKLPSFSFTKGLVPHKVPAAKAFAEDLQAAVEQAKEAISVYH